LLQVAVKLKPVNIIGGGLAGLTLGIGLQRRGVPVTILEAGRYPRNRVCGEFISGRGQDVLKRLSLGNVFFEAGATTAKTAAFFLGNDHSPIRQLEPPAWCLSRLVMDEALAKHFRESGGELRENMPLTANEAGEGVVSAKGRSLKPVEGGWRWFGVKVHARNVTLDSDLEMHGFVGGYVGLCQLRDGLVNICGLFRKRSGNQGSPGSWREMLSGPRGSVLHRRLESVRYEDNSFCSIAGLPLKPRRASGRESLCIGDALTMIPPVTGNGMSMAFEAAEMAIDPVSAYSRGETSWKEACQVFARKCDTAFGRRLAWARLLQWFMFATRFHGNLAGLALRSQYLWRVMFAMTR
jgi:2-polyprenyl-6-methoxyphenol hydroxylase-like FAD-dependent oxidoreductase